ncbi:MAG: hypothetical protein ABUK01_02590 [Leptospirales bacterium]
MVNEKHIEQALDKITTIDSKDTSLLSKRATPEEYPWMHSKGVCGIGLSERITSGKQLSDLALKVYVERKLPLSKCSTPAPAELVVDGLPNIPIDVEEIGKIELHGGTTNKSRERPAHPGSSVGLSGNMVWAGTFGMVAYKRGNPAKHYLVSSSHIIANSGLAKIGDAIVQPAAISGGTAPVDTIASLSQWVPFIFSDTGFENLVDAAIAEVTPGAVTAAITELGVPIGVSMTLARGMDVQKVGAETSYSMARIKDIHFRLPANYPTGGDNYSRAGFKDQVLTTFYAASGDSSAPVLNMNREVVGQHFAGSATVGIFSKINNLFDALDIELVVAETVATYGETECKGALDEHQDQLMKLPNVVGVGIVDADDTSKSSHQAVAVYVDHESDAAKQDKDQRIPSSLPVTRQGKQMSIPTRIIETGKITPDG